MRTCRLAATHKNPTTPSSRNPLICPSSSRNSVGANSTATPTATAVCSRLPPYSRHNSTAAASTASRLAANQASCPTRQWTTASGNVSGSVHGGFHIMIGSR